MKIKIIKTTMLSIMLAGLLIIGCTSNEDAAPTESKITKEQYETMFKKQLLDNINNKEIAPNFFIQNLGYPVWKEMKWMKYEDTEMISVPLVCVSKYTRVAVGLINNGNLTIYVTEAPTKIVQTRSTTIKDLKVYNIQLLGKMNISRTRSSGGEMADLLENNVENGSAKDLYFALEGNHDYDESSTFGDIYIETTDSGSSSDSSGSLKIFGHAWIRIEAWNEPVDGSSSGCEEVTTSIFMFIGLDINDDLEEDVSASMSKEITYDGFQEVLDYNAESSNVRYNLFSWNCTDYSMDLWNTVTGDDISLENTPSTPSALTEYIKNH